MLFHRKNKEQRTSFHSKENEKKPFIQPKLKMGTKGDKYEVEADKMADKVVNKDVVSNNTIQKKEGEEELQQKPLAAEISPLIQKNEDVEEESIQKAEEEETLQAKEEEEVQAKSNEMTTTSSLQGKLKKGSGGTKMDNQTKNEMESGFGTDLSQVNIHTDSEAAQMSQDIGAQAFTHGNDVYFNRGKYNPKSKEGKHLLAHELTHTVQQKGMVQKRIQKKQKKPNLSKVKKVENVLKGKKWISYQTIKDCNESARKQNNAVKKPHSNPAYKGSTINMYLDQKRQKQSGKITSKVNIQKGVNTIINSLLSGRPVMIGVMYETKYGADGVLGGTKGDNINVATNHYINIVGMGIDKQNHVYFSYYDNYVDPYLYDKNNKKIRAKTNKEMEKEGTNLKENRIYLYKNNVGDYFLKDKTPKTLQGGEHRRFGNVEYVVTEVRYNY